MAGLLGYDDTYAVPQNAVVMNTGAVSTTPTAVQAAVQTGNAAQAQNIASQDGGLALNTAAVQQMLADPTRYNASTEQQGQLDAYKQEETNYNTYLGGITEDWKKDFYRQYIPQNDKEYQNVQWKQNADGTWSALKSSAPGGSYDSVVKYLKDNAITDNWFQWTVDPKNVAASGSTYKQYDAPGTTGNSYAPYFLAAGALLTGGLLAPVIAGAGVAGGAAIGGGMGAANAAIGSSIANPGGGPDWGKVGIGAATGALGGAFAGGGGIGGIADALGGGTSTAMDAGTAAAYAAEAYPSGWEGSIYGSAEGLMDATGSIEGLLNSTGDFTYGDFDNATEWAAYWDEMTADDSPWTQASNAMYDSASDPAVLDAVQSATGQSLEGLAKKIGLKAAMEVAKKLMAPSTPTSNNTQASGAAAGGSGLMGNYKSSGTGGSSQLNSGSSIQQIAQVGQQMGVPVSEAQAKMIKTKLQDYNSSNITPEYWRFMSTSEEE